MNADRQDFQYKELTEKIIKIFYSVYNKLGYGFLEKVYENAMMIEFRREGIPAVSQSPIIEPELKRKTFDNSRKIVICGYRRKSAS
ncbi:MAG: GxxExxY protein [Desulfobacterales bacterium]|nr:GxxExxY protein [Desulfobacterales bacterium]